MFISAAHDTKYGTEPSSNLEAEEKGSAAGQMQWASIFETDNVFSKWSPVLLHIGHFAFEYILYLNNMASGSRPNIWSMM